MATRGPRSRDAEVVITPYRDGPLLVRGPIRIVDQHGGEIAIDRDVVALCRCGRSRIRPLCDGTHKQAGFRAPSSAESDPASAPYTPPEPSANAALNGNGGGRRNGHGPGA